MEAGNISPFRIEIKNVQFATDIEKLASGLATNPILLRTPITPETNLELYGRMKRIFQALSYDSSHPGRGQDFLNVNFQLNEEQQKWLKKHAYIANFDEKIDLYDTLKGGRLGTVVASLEPELRESIAQEIKTSRLPSNGKNIEHIARLLTHSNAPECINFAREIIKHYRQYENLTLTRQSGVPKESAIPTSSDGNNAFQFWTYGPYVLQAIIENGGDFNTFMVEWVMKRKLIPGSRLNDAFYPGIEGLYVDDRIMLNYHYLAKDGNSLSHGFADFIARNAILPAIEKLKGNEQNLPNSRQ